MPSDWINLGSEVTSKRYLIGEGRHYWHVDPDRTGHELLKAGQECECKYKSDVDGSEVEPDDEDEDQFADLRALLQEVGMTYKGDHADLADVLASALQEAVRQLGLDYDELTGYTDSEDANLGDCPYYARYVGAPGHDPNAICYQMGICEAAQEPMCVTCEPEGGWKPE